MEKVPAVQNEYLQALSNLGLSFLQAKTYLNLARLGTAADVKTIARVSNVARQDIYRVMLTLQKLGVAEKILGKKTMYKAIPIKEGFLILLQKRKQADAELENEISLLSKNFCISRLVDPQDEDDQQFKIIYEMLPLSKNHENLIRSAQISIDFILPAKVLETLMADYHSPFKKANTAVKVRAIANAIERKTSSIKLPEFEKNLDIEIRYSNNSAPVYMHIFDKNELTFGISEKNKVPAMWSNNINAIKIAEAYFESVWNKAKIN